MRFRITSLQLELLATYVASPPEGQGEASSVPPGLPTAWGQLSQPFLKQCTQPSRWSRAARLPGPRCPHGHLRAWASGPEFPNYFLPGP